MPHTPLTAVARLLQGVSSARNIRPGERIEISPPLIVLAARHALAALQALAKSKSRVAYPSRVIWFHDDNLPAPDVAAANARVGLKKLASECGLDQGHPCAGFEIPWLIHSGRLLPGECCVGAGHEIATLGGASALGLRATHQDLASLLAGKALELTVPHTVKINLTGKLPASTGGADLFWAMVHEIGRDYLAGRALEIAGEGLRELSLSRRLATTSLAAQAGLFAVYVAPDATLVTEINKRLAESVNAEHRRSYGTVNAEAGAEYALTKTLDLAKVQPMVATARGENPACSAGELAGERIDRVIIGGIGGGSLESLRLVAARLKGKRAAKGIALDVMPCDAHAYQVALSEGILATLVEAGARILPPGSHFALGILGKSRRWLSTLTSNTAGKFGEGEHWLSSPVTAIASAIAGHVVNPDTPELLTIRDSKHSTRRPQ